MTPFKFKITGCAYKGFLKKVFFLFDPEDVHDFVTAWGMFLGRFAITRLLVSGWLEFRHASLEQRIWGMNFKNPVGLAAGFDKDAKLVDILPCVGFGFEEAGSVTGQPCAGNKRPRLWRMVKSRSLLVYYGLKNGGCEKISERLKGKKNNFILGISLAKTNSQDTAEENMGIEDYVMAFKAFVSKGVGDYYTVNISCPNAYGGEPFTTSEKFEKLISAIREVPCQKPILVKLPSEMPETVLDEIIGISRKYKLAGFVRSNLAKSRDNKKILDSNVSGYGGMSGKVVQEMSDLQISHIFKKAGREFVIVGCGGIFTAEDAYKKIKLGASLLQLITGMVYNGPQIVGEINSGLVRLMKADGYANISQAIGTAKG